MTGYELTQQDSKALFGDSTQRIMTGDGYSLTLITDMI